MPKLSVVIPVYGAAQYIERCARSLFEQTLEDIEFIFVDDCSPDDSIAVLKKIIEEYPERLEHIVILRNEKNLGVLQSRLKGIDEAKGDYLIHCDSDDWVDINMYETLYFIASTKSADIVWCDFYKTNGTDRTLIQQKGFRHPICDILLGKRQGSLWNHLVKREIVRNASIINPKQNMAEDMTLLLQYFSLAMKWSYINKPLYYYFQNTTSVSSGETKAKILSQAQQMAENVDTFSLFLNLLGESDKWEKEMVFRKFFNKRWLLPVVDSIKHCDYWLECHKDINFSLYKNSYISRYEKIISLLVELRLYPLLRKVIRGR